MKASTPMFARPERGVSLNANLRVYVANGYYDLATPYFATRYTVDHLFPPEKLAERVEMSQESAI